MRCLREGRNIGQSRNFGSAATFGSATALLHTKVPHTHPTHPHFPDGSPKTGAPAGQGRAPSAAAKRRTLDGPHLAPVTITDRRITEQVPLSVAW